MPRYRWSYNLRSPKKLFFQTCVSYKSLGFKIFNKTLWFQDAGKTRYTSDRKCYDVIAGRRRKNLEHSHIIYHSKGLSLFIICYQKTNIWKTRKKGKFDIFFSFVIQKNLTQGTTGLKFAEDIWNKVYIKPVSFCMKYVLYQRKVNSVIKLFKAPVKIRNFSIGYCKYDQKKYYQLTTSAG